MHAIQLSVSHESFLLSWLSDVLLPYSFMNVTSSWSSFIHNVKKHLWWSHCLFPDREVSSLCCSTTCSQKDHHHLHQDYHPSTPDLIMSLSSSFSWNILNVSGISIWSGSSSFIGKVKHLLVSSSSSLTSSSVAFTKQLACQSLWRLRRREYIEVHRYVIACLAKRRRFIPLISVIHLVLCHRCSSCKGSFLWRDSLLSVLFSLRVDLLSFMLNLFLLQLWWWSLFCIDRLIKESFLYLPLPSLLLPSLTFSSQATAVTHSSNLHVVNLLRFQGCINSLEVKKQNQSPFVYRLREWVYKVDKVSQVFIYNTE